MTARPARPMRDREGSMVVGLEREGERESGGWSVGVEEVMGGSDGVVEGATNDKRVNRKRRLFRGKKTMPKEGLPRTT